MSLSLILSLLRTVSWPHWRAHPVSTLLTVTGISLGIAAVISIASVSNSVLVSAHEMVQALSGAADIELSSAGAGLQQKSVMAAVDRVAGIRSKGGLVEAFVPLVRKPEEQIFLLGIDFLDRSIWLGHHSSDLVQLDNPLAFMRDKNAIAVTRSFLARHDLEVGDTLQLLTPRGPRRLRIRGLIEERGPARLFGGNFGLMDLPAAQALLAKRRLLDRVAIVLASGADPKHVRDQLTRELDGRAEVSVPESRGQRAEKLLLSLRTALMIMSLGALIVAGFVVYHTVAVSIHRRQRTLGILSAVGVHRGSLLALCVLETMFLAGAGSALGLLAGRVFAQFATGFVGDVTSSIWLRLEVAAHGLSASGAITAMMLGVSAAGSAAFLAARTALGQPTVESLRPGARALAVSVSTTRTLAVATAMLCGVWLALLAPPDLGFLSLVTVVVGTCVMGCIGTALLSPLLVRGLGSLARTAAVRWRGFSLRLAVENVPREELRHGATVATLAMPLSLAIMVLVLATSFERSWMRWVQQHFSADIYVARGGRLRLIAGPPIDRTLGDELARIPGVTGVEPFRTIPFSLGDRPVFLEGVSVATRLKTGDLPMVEGTLHAAAPHLLDGTGVLLSDNLAYRMKLHRNDVIALTTLEGTRTFRVEGTFVDYLGSLDLGSILVDVAVLERHWGDRMANLFRVWVAPGALESVRERIAEFGRGQGLYVIDAAGFLADMADVVDRFFRGFWVLELVAALVGIIGVVNAQMAGVMDRAQELTVLRAIGIPGRALRRMVVLECAEIGLFGGLAGVMLGVLLGAQIVLVSARLVTGLSMGVLFPFATIAAGLAFVVAISAVAGYIPARAIRRMTIAPVVAD